MLTRLCARVSRELLNTTGYRKTTKCSFSGLTCNLINSALKKDCVFDIHRLSKSNGIYLIRYESTIKATVKESPASNTDIPIPQAANIAETDSVIPENNLISEIPDLPIAINEGIKEIAQVIKYHANGEPTFESLGLGGYSPFGLIRTFYEFVHINCDLPWWLTIMLISTLLKLALFRTSIITQRNNAKMQLFLPNIVTLQEQMSEARKCGNEQEAMICATKLQHLMKKNSIKLFPIANFMKIGVHIPVFITLRSIANNHVESLEHGGFLWFMNLNEPDPYYIMPLCTSITLYCVTALVMQQSAVQNIPPLMKKLFKLIPIVSFLFSIRLPGTILCHWFVCNMLTLVENEVLKLEKVKMYFNIPLSTKPKETMDPRKTKGVKQTLFETMDSFKTSHKLSSFTNADTIQFNQAAKGPLKKTFKHNPLNDLSGIQTTTPMKAIKK